MEVNLHQNTTPLISALLNKKTCFNEVVEISKTLPDENFFIAGGLVRDFFRGSSQFKDIDLFVSKSAFLKLSELINTTGSLIQNPFGSYRWHPCLDSQIYYDIIIIEDFYNGLSQCNSIKDVLLQFDMTINAIAIDLNSGLVHNPLNALQHIEQKIIQAVRFDYPEIPLSEDILLSRNSILWFRYNHYSIKLGFSFEDKTLQWIKENSYRLRDIDLFSSHFYNPEIPKRFAELQED